MVLVTKKRNFSQLKIKKRGSKNENYEFTKTNDRKN